MNDAPTTTTPMLPPPGSAVPSVRIPTPELSPWVLRDAVYERPEPSDDMATWRPARAA